VSAKERMTQMEVLEEAEEPIKFNPFRKLLPITWKIAKKKYLRRTPTVSTRNIE